MLNSQLVHTACNGYLALKCLSICGVVWSPSFSVCMSLVIVFVQSEAETRRMWHILFS